jgi:hypothetical protein
MARRKYALSESKSRFILSIHSSNCFIVALKSLRLLTSWQILSRLRLLLSDLQRESVSSNVICTLSSFKFYVSCLLFSNLLSSFFTELYHPSLILEYPIPIICSLFLISSDVGKQIPRSILLFFAIKIKCLHGYPSSENTFLPEKNG